MTKVQIHFQLESPLDDAMAMRLSDANSLYGIDRIQIEPTLKEIMVEYDASRLKASEVQSVLEGLGIAMSAK
ncbi:MAG: hypothetical protein M3Z36_08380 [Acidobacteriota bacterium]|nr:hypothetical protein [Acidobacteriota bacterium]